MVDFGKIGRFSRFRTVCFGFFFGFCWGGSRKKNGRKKYLTSNIVGNGAIEFESLPSKGFREHHWGCFEMDWMRGKEITYCMTYMTYRGLEDFFGRVLLLPCSLNVKWHSQIDRLVIFFNVSGSFWKAAKWYFAICCIHIESLLGGGIWHHHFSLANLPQGLNRFPGWQAFRGCHWINSNFTWSFWATKMFILTNINLERHLFLVAKVKDPNN